MEKKRTRPPKEVNWELVERMIEAQCTLGEIAGTLNIHIDTMADKVKAQYGITFTELTQRKAMSGLGILKLAQYQKALNNSAKGNVQMLIYLGKVLLGQKEKDEKLHEDIEELKIRLDLWKAELDANRNPVKES